MSRTGQDGVLKGHNVGTRLRKPWVFVRVLYIDPVKFWGLSGPGILNQAPTSFSLTFIPARACLKI